MTTRPERGEVWKRKAGDRRPWLLARVRRSGKPIVRIVLIDDPHVWKDITMSTLLRGFTRCRA